MNDGVSGGEGQAAASDRTISAGAATSPGEAGDGAPPKEANRRSPEEPISALMDLADPAPSELAPPARVLFDHAVVAADLDAIAKRDAPVGEKRSLAAKRLRAALEDGSAALREAFDRNHRLGYGAAVTLAWLTDQVVVAAYRFVSERLFPLVSPTTSERAALVAVGGYGRGELAPFSDVDLLFLTPYKQTAWGENVIETTLYILWDLKLKVGHATRSVDECVRRAGSDVTIRTALLENRYLAGSKQLHWELDDRLWSELFEGTGPEFVDAKLAERDARHLRTGGSRYLLEPNVKESKGGLRDLQTIFWLAKYLYRSSDSAALAAKGVFSDEEATRCRWAANTLWTVRFALHYTAGRAQEKLTFDHQIELAERFGYRAVRGQRPVERFMKRYFLAAKAVGDLTAIFCAALEHEHKKTPPLLGGLMRLLANGGDQARARSLRFDWLEIVDGRIGVRDPARLREQPVSILYLFAEAVRLGVAVHPAAVREVDQSRRAVDTAFRDSPEAQDLFVELITNSRDPARALRMLHVTGVLGRFIPEFGRVVGLMQFNMYHHYTVDEHSILAVETFYRIASGDLRDEHPVETEIAQRLADRRVIAVTLLLHDIGKGLPDDHSVAGARIARVVCPALGMTPGETEQVSWLIRHHLAMSNTAQKRDLAEPATIRSFAELVRSPNRLRLLYVLTACDIRAVGPGVWNGWKAQLLRQLYRETHNALMGEAPEASRSERVDEAKAALLAQLRAAPGDAAAWSDAAWAIHSERFNSTYWSTLPTSSHLEHAALMGPPAVGPSAAAPPVAAPAPDASPAAAPPQTTASNQADALRMAARTSPTRDATEVSFFTQDHPGLFARMAGAFALVGASVMDARAFTTRDGMAVNTFWVRDSEGGPYEDPDRLNETMRRVLGGEITPRDALKSRRKLRPRERPFEVTPSVSFDNDASDLLTMIEVNCRDRVGLLHDLARSLANEHVNIVSAIIATYGEHVVDVFYVKDLFGMKITAQSKRARIERALLSAIDKAAPPS